MNKLNIARVAIATGFIINAVASVMAIVHIIKNVGFTRLMFLNELGVWVELFKSSPSFAWLIIGLSVLGAVIWFGGKVLVQMVADEQEAKRFKLV